MLYKKTPQAEGERTTLKKNLFKNSMVLVYGKKNGNNLDSIVNYLPWGKAISLGTTLSGNHGGGKNQYFL